MRRAQESPVSPTQVEAILMLHLTSSKLYLPTHEPGPAVQRMHRYRHSAHGGNRGKGNESRRASNEAAGVVEVEVRVLRVTRARPNSSCWTRRALVAVSLQPSRRAPQRPRPLTALRERRNGPNLHQISTAAQGGRGRPVPALSAMECDGANGMRYDDFGCTTNSSLHQLRCSPSANGLVAPDCAIPSSTVRDSPGPSWLPLRQIWSSVRAERPEKHSPILVAPGWALALIASVRLALLHLGQILHSGQATNKAESWVPPQKGRDFGSGFPPDVIEANDTRLGRRGFTPVLLRSNTPLQEPKQERALL